MESELIREQPLGVDSFGGRKRLLIAGVAFILLSEGLKNCVHSVGDGTTSFCWRTMKQGSKKAVSSRFDEARKQMPIGTTVMELSHKRKGPRILYFGQNGSKL